MGRGKFNMELIANVKSRNVTYKKRKAGLIKKAEEFATLCDVETCVIIFHPKDGPPAPETFPLDSSKVRNTINKFKAKKFSNDSKRTKNQDMSDFFVSRKKKVDADISKLRQANLEARFPAWDDRFNVFSLEEFRDLYTTFDTKLQVAKRKLTMMKCDQFLISKSGTNLCGSNDMDSEFYNQHLLSTYGKRHDHMQLPPYNCSSSHAVQMLSFDYNPIANPMTMLMMNGVGDDYNQYDGGLSRSNIPYTRIIPTYYEAAMPENVVHNPRSLPTWYHGATMQPMAPYGQQVMTNGSSHANGPQFSEFFRDINVKGSKHED